ALVRAKDPGANADNVIARLLDTATPMTGASAAAYGRGIVDPVSALTDGRFSVDENPLGQPAAARTVSESGGTTWAWIAVPVVVLVAGLLGWVLLWRHRRRPVVAAKED